MSRRCLHGDLYPYPSKTQTPTKGKGFLWVMVGVDECSKGKKPSGGSASGVGRFCYKLKFLQKQCFPKLTMKKTTVIWWRWGWSVIINAIPCFSYQKAGNDLLNQFFTILLPKVYHANNLRGSIWVKIYLLTTLTYPHKNPNPCQGWGFAKGQKKSQPLPLPSWPLTFTPKGFQTLAHRYQGQLSWSGNGVPGQEDDESEGTEKEV